MNIIGKWKVSKCMLRDENGDIVFLSQDEYKDTLMQQGRDERSIARSLASFAKVVMFCEDGKYQTLNPIPDSVSQAEIDAAVESGRVVVIDRMAVEGSSKWKEENGEFFHEAGIDGETNEISWSRIKIIDDNTISLMMFELVRM